MENDDVGDEIDNWELAEDKDLERKIEAKMKKKQQQCSESGTSGGLLLRSKNCDVTSESAGIKILKRPCHSSSSAGGVNESTNGEADMIRCSSKSSLKSLEEREAAYAEARSRIFGTLESACDSPQPSNALLSLSKDLTQEEREAQSLSHNSSLPKQSSTQSTTIPQEMKSKKSTFPNFFLIP